MPIPKIYDIVQFGHRDHSQRNIPIEHFTVPLKNNKHILYFPRNGVVALVNKDFVSKIGTEDFTVKKMFEFARKYIAPGGSSKELENDIIVELTKACNLKCIYCYAKGGDNPRYMDWKTAKAGIDYQIDRCKDRTFLLEFHGGGEPLLAFDMMKQCYEYAKKKCDKKGIRLNVACTTNGTLITEEVVKWMKKVDMSVILSFDGTEEIQNQQRPFRDGSGSYENLKKIIELFNKYRVNYYTHSTITENSVDEMVKIIKNLKNLEVKKCEFQCVWDWGRNHRKYNSNLYHTKYRDGLHKIIEFSKKHDITVLNLNKNKIPRPINIACRGCGYDFVVTANRDVTSCITAVNPADPAHKIFCYGKIKNGKVIINKKKLTYLRSRNVKNIPQCKDCFARYICAGGCVAESARNAKSIFEQTEDECTKKKIEAVEILKNILNRN